MEDILKQKIKESLGKEGKLILLNEWKYTGEVIDFDETHFEFLDYKYNESHTIRYDYVKDFIRSVQ